MGSGGLGLAIARQLFTLLRDGESSLQRVDYALRGKLNGPLLTAARFESRGEVTLPKPPTTKP